MRRRYFWTAAKPLREGMLGSGPRLVRRQGRTIVGILAAVAVVAVILGSIAVQFAGGVAERQVRSAANELLAAQLQAVTGLTEKFRLLPNLVERYPAVGEYFENPDQGDAATLRSFIRQLAALSGALEIGLLSPTGTSLLSAWGRLSVDLPMDSTAYLAVSQGRLGREVRQVSPRVRAYLFAHGVRNEDGQLIGIVTTLIDLGVMEQAWSLSADPVFVSDQSGMILAANRVGWRMRPLDEISETNEVFENYLDLTRTLPQAGWTLHVLANPAGIRTTQTLVGTAIAVLAMLIGVVLITMVNRQFAHIRRQRKDRVIALRLERIVRDRTRALSLEVDQHKITSDSLRQTQAELVQAGKMAALGQMSAALSHEYNQPLTATRSYADNAILLLKRGQTDEASENIKRISEMVDRMATISKGLTNFARKPKANFGAVPLDPVVGDALAILAPRIRQANAVIEVTPRASGAWVLAGQVRLQQVLVNLIGNALDAMSAEANPRVEIEIDSQVDAVLLRVRDYGTGIPDDVVEHMFDPFFTTKGPGGGLGLGLSISYNIVKDFGGRITAENIETGGARFTVELQRAETRHKAAE